MSSIAPRCRKAAYDYLANELVLPAVRSAFINDWEVREPGPALTLVEGLAIAEVGDDIVQALLDQVRRLVLGSDWMLCRRLRVRVLGGGVTQPKGLLGVYMERAMSLFAACRHQGGVAGAYNVPSVLFSSLALD